MAIVHGTNNAETIDASDGVANNADTIYGYGGKDKIFGLGGNDFIIGGAGADEIDGGDGVDTAFYTDSSEGVTVQLMPGTGTGGTAEGDKLAGIENLYGSAFMDYLVGDNGKNSLAGMQGQDFLYGFGGVDVLSGGTGDDLLQGGSGADTLYGGDGSDTVGYGGSSEGVVVSLLTGQALKGDAEGDTFSDIENINGSAHDDQLHGDNVANRLKGLEGEDTLKGYGGTDRLFGGDNDDALFGMDGDDELFGEDGDDTLNGGTGGDAMAGGEGNDTYYVDYFLDTISEVVGEGTQDRVLVYTGGYALDAGAEVEFIEYYDPTSTLAIEIGGNEFSNTVIANDGDNVLGGRGGGDVLIGRDGNDVYYVVDSGDVIVELAGEGFDTVRTSVNYTLAEDAELERLEAADDSIASPLALTGNSIGNEIIGNVGDNIIDGRGGRDMLHGLGGADTFLWSFTKETGLTAATADLIADFNFAEGDRIDLSDIDADVYAAGNQAFTFIGTAAFSGTPGEINYYHSGGNTFVQLQTGTSADVEGVIRIDGIVTPQASWFLL